jgi:flagellar biosynthesis chaperone FliJ
MDGLKYMHENTLEQSQHEVDALKNQLRTCQRKEAELFQKHLAAEAELQNRNGVLHNSQLQLATLQTNNQNLLQMLESYESKVAHQAKKVKKAEDELHEAIEQFKEASKENDLLEWKLTEKQQLLERRDAENRSERERLGKLYTERMEAQRASLHEEHERLEE